ADRRRSRAVGLSEGARQSNLAGGGTVFAFEPGEIDAGRAHFLLQSAALGIGDGAGRVLRLDLVIAERIEQELFSHILEEALLSPALDNAVGAPEVARVPIDW